MLATESAGRGGRTEDQGQDSTRAKRSHTKEGGLIMTCLRVFVAVCLLLAVVGEAGLVPFGLAPVAAASSKTNPADNSLAQECKDPASALHVHG